MSSHPHGLRFSPFANNTNKNNIMSAQQQPQQQTPAIPVRSRKSATPTNIPVPTPKSVVREVKLQPSQPDLKNNSNFSDTDDDEHDYFEDENDANLSKEDRYVLLQPRAEPQGQENLSGNVTPVNDNQRKFSLIFSSILYFLINVCNFQSLTFLKKCRQIIRNQPKQDILVLHKIQQIPLKDLVTEAYR